MTFQLHNLDATEFLRSLPTNSVDLLITDPAYESLEKHRATGTTTRLKHSKSSSNDWFEIFRNERFPAWFAEAYRVLAPNAHLYFYCDAETMFVAKPIAEAAGFKFWKPIVWDKVTIGMGYHYRARYEFVLFFEKGKVRLADLGVADIITAKRVRAVRACACGYREDTCNVHEAPAESTLRATSNSGPSEAGIDSPMSLSGSDIMDPSRQGTRSITGTRSRRTTGSRISNLSTESPTSESTPGANSEAASGGSRAASAETSSLSPQSTGTSCREPLGRSIGAACATSPPRSCSRRRDACPLCGSELTTRAPYATEKPVAVSDVLVRQSSAPGEVVVDCFMGSGSVGEAAIRAGRRFIGNDLSAGAVDGARARLITAGGTEGAVVQHAEPAVFAQASLFGERHIGQHEHALEPVKTTSQIAELQETPT
jgi:DNA modification methylase